MVSECIHTLLHVCTSIKYKKLSIPEYWNRLNQCIICAHVVHTCFEINTHRATPAPSGRWEQAFFVRVSRRVFYHFDKDLKTVSFILRDKGLKPTYKFRLENDAVGMAYWREFSIHFLVLYYWLV